MNKIERYKTLIISILFLFFSTSCDELSKVFFPTLEDKIVGNWSLV
jgi:preprotein translocase subunit SecE